MLISRAGMPMAMALLLLSAGAAQSKIIYVNQAVLNSGNGASWASSYKYLRDALDDSSAGDQIYLAKGTYYPDEGKTGSFGDREFSFEMKGQKIYGGFAGTEANLNQRNPVANPTILSGAIWDLEGEDVYWSLHVVVLNQSSTLDGVTVEDGHASGSDSWAYPTVSSFDEGGGCYVKAGKTLTLNDCTFRNNRALAYGGAIMIEDNAGKVVATDCLFENNGIPLIYDITTSVPEGGAIKGNVIAKNCRFTGNFVRAIPVVKTSTSLAAGGAISGNVTADACEFNGNSAIAIGGDSVALGGALSGNASLTHCNFSNNESAATVGAGISSGGAVCGGSVTAVGCSFTSNVGGTGIIEDDGTGSGGGGAVFVSSGKSLLANCIFVGNTSRVRGGAIHGGTSDNADSLVVANCTFLDNGVEIKFRGAAISCGGIVRILNNVLWYSGDSAAGYDRTNLIHVVLHGVLRNSDVNYPTPATIAPNIAKIGEDGLPAAISRGPGADIFLGNLSDTILLGDPLFVNAADPDGADNRWGTSDDGLRPGLGSPAIVTSRDPRIPGFVNLLPRDILDIDTDGNVTEPLPLDIVGVLRIQQSFLDLGPYEFGTVVQTPEIAVFNMKGGEIFDGGSVGFGSVPVRANGKQDITIRNTGTGTLRNLSFSLTGSNTFSLKKSVITLLGSGASTTITVYFKTTGKGRKTARLVVTNNDADENPFDINLSAAGILRRSAPVFASTLPVVPTRFMETGTQVAVADHTVTTTTTSDGLKYLVLTVQKTAGSTGDSQSVEVSSDLLNWSSGVRHTTTLLDDSILLRVRDNTPLNKGGKRYIRLR